MYELKFYDMHFYIHYVIVHTEDAIIREAKAHTYARWTFVGVMDLQRRVFIPAYSFA